MNNRRDFLRNIFGVAALSAVPSLSFGKPIKPKYPIIKEPTYKYSYKWDTKKISEYTYRIEDCLNRQSPLRKVLDVDHLYKGALSCYNRYPKFSHSEYEYKNGLKIKSHLISRPGEIFTIDVGESALTPTFELSSCGKDLKFLMDDLLDKEDKQLAFLLENSVKDIHVNRSTKSKFFKSINTFFSSAFTNIEKYDYTIANTIMHPSMLALIMKQKTRFSNDGFYCEETDNRVSLKNNLHGHIWTSDVVLCKSIKPNEIYFTTVGDRSKSAVINTTMEQAVIAKYVSKVNAFQNWKLGWLGFLMEHRLLLMVQQWQLRMLLLVRC